VPKLAGCRVGARLPYRGEVSPRHNRRTGPAAQPRDPDLPGGGAADWRGETYLVRRVSGAGARKPYRCPGCDQEISPGTPHVVVWPTDQPDAEQRRHWHAACWQARDRRAARVHRGRAAPRYG
jgi:hypothetical protein